MQLTQAQIDNWKPGGSTYLNAVSRYGQAVADAASNAAMQPGALESDVSSAIANATYGAPLTTSTTGIFLNQLATDPLAAPLNTVNTAVGNSFMSLFKSPWVLALIGLSLFFWMGGLKALQGSLKK
jgi:hypothetical protein